VKLLVLFLGLNQKFFQSTMRLSFVLLTVIITSPFSYLFQDALFPILNPLSMEFYRIMKTYSAKSLEVERIYWLIDAEGLTLGRLASLIANLLRGKHKPTFTPHLDTGDFVVVVNASKIKVTGNKFKQKEYKRHTGYPGGLKVLTFREMMDKKPEKPLEIAVKGMLPHTSLGRQQFTKLKVFAGPDHTHAAQKPIVYQVNQKGC
jgi:large subunit ribosomal protein L13